MGVVALMQSFGCATIFQSGPDRIRVNSNPQGAKVLLNDDPVGTTPMVLSVNHRDDCVIKIEKEGYETYTMDRGKTFSGWFLGNILLGGIIGGTVDLVTHNQGHYSEDPVFVEMNAKGPAPASTP